jgi:hypothetical protein
MMDIELNIEGISDRRIAEAIRKTVRALGRQVRGTGERRVSIGPSETRGEWDLGFRETPCGWQLVSFVGPAEVLPDLVECQLRKLLDRSAGSAVAR